MEAVALFVIDGLGLVGGLCVEFFCFVLFVFFIMPYPITKVRFLEIRTQYLLTIFLAEQAKPV